MERLLELRREIIGNELVIASITRKGKATS